MAVQVELVGCLRLGLRGRFRDAHLTRHARLALAYFVLERDRRITREELADLLWEERLPPSWKPALRGVVGRVRAAFGACGLTEVLLTGAGWYELVLPGDTTVDVEAADAVLTAARLLDDGQVDLAREAATSALGVASRPFLLGVHAAWVDQRQDLLESGYRRLALAHSGAGDRGEALRVLARCRAMLAEEVGADASPELEAPAATLHGGVVARTSVLFGVSPATTPASPLVADRSGPFVGRAGAHEQAERGRTPILAIDEAHMLTPPQLEAVRMLTNHDLDSVSPMACLLIGQPTFRRMIKLGVLAALDQRIAVRYIMDAMTREETSTYIAHHVKLAGRADTLFADDAVELIHNTSRGLPRAVNNLAVQALLAAYADRKAIVDLASTRIAVNEVTTD